MWQKFKTKRKKSTEKDSYLSSIFPLFHSNQTLLKQKKKRFFVTVSPKIFVSKPFYLFYFRKLLLKKVHSLTTFSIFHRSCVKNFLLSYYMGQTK